MKERLLTTYSPALASLLVICLAAAATTDRPSGNISLLPDSPACVYINSPPDSAVLVSPDDMATDADLSPALEASVSDPDGDTLTVAYYGRPKCDSIMPAFSIIHLPDTQYYTGNANGGHPTMFVEQTHWIVNRIVADNIAYVAHVGDIVDAGDYAPWQWDNAWFAMSLLEDSTTTGMPYGLPYSISVGSHDQSPIGDPDGTTTYYNQFYGSAHFEGRPYYGGHFSTNNDNNFTLFSAGGLDFIVVTMEYDLEPNPDVLAWADVQLRAHPNRWGIVNCHNLLEYGTPAVFSSQGQAVYDALKTNPNLFLMLCGHLYELRRSDTYGGHTVHTVLANYQERPHGGDGWLRVIKVFPTEDYMQFSTFSPELRMFETDESSEFTLSCDLVPSQDWQLIGAVADVPSGTTAGAVWADRLPLTEYEWYTVVSDAESSTTGPVWSFTTGSGPPVVEVLSPNGGEYLMVGTLDSLEWCAADDSGVTSVDLLLSRTGASGDYEAIATDLPNTGLFEWTVSGPDTYQAVLKVIAHDADGKTGERLSDSTFTICDVGGIAEKAAADYALEILSPQPLYYSGHFSIVVPHEAHVTLRLFDTQGRDIAVIADGMFGVGQHTLCFDGGTSDGNLSPGVYFLRMEACGRVVNHKVVLVR